MKFTAAYACFIKTNNPLATKIVVGRDARLSGSMVEKLVVGTLMSMGLDVINIGLATTPTGNADYLPNGTTSFIYKNTVLSSTTTWGTGVQMPLQYFGYNSEVNLVLKSYYGFADEQSYCVPYIMNIRYFRPEY